MIFLWVRTFLNILSSLVTKLKPRSRQPIFSHYLFIACIIKKCWARPGSSLAQSFPRSYPRSLYSPSSWQRKFELRKNLFAVVTWFRILFGWFSLHCYRGWQNRVLCLYLLEHPMAHPVVIYVIISNSNESKKCMKFSKKVLENSVNSRCNIISFSVLGYLYFWFATILWINLMSYDIWSTLRWVAPLLWKNKYIDFKLIFSIKRDFREMRSNSSVDINERNRAKFFGYSIYVWVGALGVIVCFIIGIQFHDLLIIILGVLILFIVTPISDIYFLISSASMMKEQERNIAENGDASNKIHVENRQWYVQRSFLEFIRLGNRVVLLIRVSGSSAASSYSSRWFSPPY